MTELNNPQIFPRLKDLQIPITGGVLAGGSWSVCGYTFYLMIKILTKRLEWGRSNLGQVSPVVSINVYSRLSLTQHGDVDAGWLNHNIRRTQSLASLYDIPGLCCGNETNKIRITTTHKNVLSTDKECE